ncbi:MAG TPA: hypothetical protein EYG90_01530 [Campylobacterales bacterium]|nr:hypothetical protein [Campylobacterales bacterium]
MDRHLFNEIKHIAHSMFQKNFFGVFHGSISTRTSINSFSINRKFTILDDVQESCFIHLNCLGKQDYRWNEASVDVEIHKEIYKAFPNAKYISYTMPPYATAYSIAHDSLAPQDYYGKQMLGEITIYDPQKFTTWEKRAPHEIINFFKKNNTHLLLIKGFGLISYDRDLTEMVKKVAILENSCKLLTLSSVME